MRGVAGLELEILRAKARGEAYEARPGSAAHEVFHVLRDRGLLRLTGTFLDSAGQRWRENEITPIGRVVLAASLGSAL